MSSKQAPAPLGWRGQDACTGRQGAPGEGWGGTEQPWAPWEGREHRRDGSSRGSWPQQSGPACTSHRVLPDWPKAPRTPLSTYPRPRRGISGERRPGGPGSQPEPAARPPSRDHVVAPFHGRGSRAPEPAAAQGLRGPHVSARTPPMRAHMPHTAASENPACTRQRTPVRSVLGSRVWEGACPLLAPLRTGPRLPTTPSAGPSKPSSGCLPHLGEAQACTHTHARLHAGPDAVSILSATGWHLSQQGITEFLGGPGEARGIREVGQERSSRHPAAHWQLDPDLPVSPLGPPNLEPHATQHGPCGHTRTCGGRGQGAGGAASHTAHRCPPSCCQPLRRPSSHPLLRVSEGAGWPPTPTLPSEAQMRLPTSPAHGTEPDLQQTEAAWPRGAEIPGRWHHTPAGMHCRRGADPAPPPRHAATPRPGCPRPGPPEAAEQLPTAESAAPREGAPSRGSPQGEGLPRPAPPRAGPWGPEP